jgi:hypothetical protein
MKTTRTLAHLKKYAYISVSCLVLSSCLGVFEKQPERYNTVLGGKRSPINNPKVNRPAPMANGQTRSPSGNPAGAMPQPQGELTPYDQYPSEVPPEPYPAQEPATFQQDDRRVEAVPMNMPEPAPAPMNMTMAMPADVSSETGMTEDASGQSALEPSPLFYYEQQQQQAGVVSQPLENIPLSNNTGFMPSNLTANADLAGVQQDIDSMYDASTIPQNNYMPSQHSYGASMNYHPDSVSPALNSATSPEPATQIAQNYVPVIENTPSPLQQFETEPTAFPELGAIPAAPNYEANFNNIQQNASQFANQYSPELGAAIPPPYMSPHERAVTPPASEDQPAAIIEQAESPLAQYEREQQLQSQISTYDPAIAPPPAPLPVEMPPVQPLGDISPVQAAPAPVENTEYVEQSRVREFVAEAPMTAIPPVAAQSNLLDRSMARRPEMQYESLPPVEVQQAPLAMDIAPPPPPVALAPAPEPIASPPAPRYETITMPAPDIQQQPYAPPPPPVAAVNFSRQPVVMPEQPTYQPVEAAPLPPQEYVTQSEYPLEEIAAAPPPQQREVVIAPVPMPVAPTVATAPVEQANMYQQELLQTYDPEKNTVSIPDAPEIAQPARVFSSSEPITLTPPPSIRARKGEAIANSKYNLLRRSRATSRATLRH